MLALFISKVIAYFAGLSPLLVIGKFMDFHLLKVGQERTKDAVGDIYLKMSCGSAFQDYCRTVLNILIKQNLVTVYLAVLFLFLICGMAIELFLFHNIRLSDRLFSRYIFLAFCLSPLGLLDYWVTKQLLRCAAAGRVWQSLIMSVFFIYISYVVSAAFLSTFFLSWSFEAKIIWEFFLNRLKVVFFNPLSPGMSVTSSMGYSVNVMGFAYPLFAISSFVAGSGIFIWIMSSKSFHGLYDYFAERILGKEEKAIHLKLAMAVSGLLAVIGAALSIKIGI